MYERFTDRARKVMALANGEAQRFNHEYIGTEHMLLGLIKEGGGVGANVLKNLDIDIRRVRLEVEKLVKSGPDMVTLGKLPQTPRAQAVIQYAIQEARNLNHNYVGTEHILLGLLAEHDGVAAQVLLNLGLSLDDTREEVLSLLGANNRSISENIPKDQSKLTQSHIIRTIASLMIRKDDAIRRAEYEEAAKIREEIENLRDQVHFAEKDAVKTEPAVSFAYGDQASVTTNYSHILARIDIAENAIRDLLSAAAIDSDISVIKHLTQVIGDLHSLHEYYEKSFQDTQVV